MLICLRKSDLKKLLILAFLASAANAETYHLYYLGGQSNMEGFGYNEELPDTIARTSERVWIFTGQMALDDEAHAGTGVWAPLQPGHGTGFRSDGHANEYSDRFGPELTFGQTISDAKADTKIAIIKYALGGSGLADGVGFGNWYPDYVGETGTNQYDHFLKTLRNGLAYTDIDGDGTPDKLVPKGIVWMQGEADAYDSQAAADAYQANLKRLMDLIRAALRVDDLPVVIGRITDSGMADDGKVMDYIETVQRAQRQFVDSDPCAAYATITDALQHSDDAWHYRTDGYIRMGTAFAEAMLELEQTCGP